jgi:hypothetical protein
MTLAEKIDILDITGNWIKTDFPESVIEKAVIQNPWFTNDNIRQALQAVAQQYFVSSALQSWISRYEIPAQSNIKTIGLVLAGNIPMVGIHDVMCTFLSGHKSKIKFAEKDSVLIPEILKYLTRLHPAVNQWFEGVDKLSEYDAVIATGSNQTAVYFSRYFSHVPHIIRKNRHAIAVLNGEENHNDLKNLAKDIFLYFGLGCRNVSQIFVPKGYDFHPLLNIFNVFAGIMQHHKYSNNYEYNKALYLLNREQFLEHPCIILRESEAVSSRIACLHYQYYNSIEEIKEFINIHHDEIQCITSNSINALPGIIPFGNAQQPSVDTYADGVDTMSFLLNL